MKLGCALLAIAATSTTAHADDEPRASASYLVDGGMVPFFWIPLTGALVIDQTVEPRSTPLWFSASEGGKAQAPWEVPSLAVTSLGVGLGIGMIASGHPSRRFHVKGLGESLMTTTLISSGLKVIFGRHRPDRSPTNDGPDEHKSFPSGHARQAFAIGTYAALYLRDHAFDGWSWQAGLTYAGIGLGAAAIGAERVLHHRHNISDVTAGAILGAASSYLFYRYQERRYRRAIRR